MRTASQPPEVLLSDSAKQRKAVTHRRHTARSEGVEYVPRRVICPWCLNTRATATVSVFSTLAVKCRNCGMRSNFIDPRAAELFSRVLRFVQENTREWLSFIMGLPEYDKLKFDIGNEPFPEGQPYAEPSHDQETFSQYGATMTVEHRLDRRLAALEIMAENRGEVRQSRSLARARRRLFGKFSTPRNSEAHKLVNAETEPDE